MHLFITATPTIFNKNTQQTNMGHGEAGAEPISNGFNVIRSIQHVRVHNRIPCGPEQPFIKVSGAPIHPWSMYTDKGDGLLGMGTQLARYYPRKFLAVNIVMGSTFFGMIWLFLAAGPRPKTQTRKWKEAEVNSYYPFEQFPDMKIPADIDKDPKAACWRFMDKVGLRPSLYLSYATNVRKLGFENQAKFKDN